MVFNLILLNFNQLLLDFSLYLNNLLDIILVVFNHLLYEQKISVEKHLNTKRDNLFILRNYYPNNFIFCF